MNQPIPQQISHIPVQMVCEGVIGRKVPNSPTYDIDIIESQLGPSGAPVRATPIYAPGASQDYKPGDHVKVLQILLYNMNDERFEDNARPYRTHILGLYNPESIIDVDIENPISETGDDRTVLKNKNTQAGVVATDNYELTLTPGGAVSHTLKAFGSGIFKNSSLARTQNYHRIISHNDPGYESREYFGMYNGADLTEESTNMAPEDNLINYRRFVQQSRDLSNWVSTCEGAYSPWVGANNNNEKVTQGKDVLFTKIINSGTNRITCEMGEVGNDFIVFRVDDVILGEKMAPSPCGATPGQLGNRFRLTIGDDGSFEIYAGGKGTPSVNTPTFKMKVTADGELEILAKKITFSHGDADKAINSIVLDKAGGIEVSAQSGFTVNGKKLINENFIDWLATNSAGLCTSVLPPGAPEPMSAPALATFNVQKSLPDSATGFLSAGVPMPATGVIVQEDLFLTVA